MKKLHILAIAIATSLVLVGCSSDGAEKEPSDKPSSSTAPKAAASGAPDKSLGDPIAERTTDIDGFKITLKVYPVKRSGELTNVNFSLTRTDDGDGNWQIGRALTDGDTDSGDDAIDAVDGVKLLDPTSKQVYLAASDGAGNCLCTRGLFGVFIRAGETTTFNATYAAPPKSVASIDLMFPLFGTVAGVALN